MILPTLRPKKKEVCQKNKGKKKNIIDSERYFEVEKLQVKKFTRLNNKKKNTKICWNNAERNYKNNNNNNTSMPQKNSL